MANNDDLMIEVTGSSTKASNALDKVIAKVTQMQEAIEKVTPSLSKFTERLDSISAGSRAFTMLEKLTKGTGDLSTAGKKAEANEAMYQARLDRATVSMERSRVASEKLASAREKLAKSAEIDNYNKNLFSMSPEDFAKKFSKSTTTEPASAPIKSVPDQSVPTVNYDVSKIQSEMDAVTAGIGSKSQSVNINTDAATAEVRRMGEYIDSLTPKISHMSSEAQAQFNAIAAKITTVSQKIDNQRMIYSNLASKSASVAKEQGEGSTAYLQLEKRMLSADSATQKLLDTQEKLKAELSSVASESNKTGIGMVIAGIKSKSAADKSTSSWGKTLQMMQKMFIRIAAFKIFSAISQGLVTGINDIVQANSQANDTMSALATNSLYLKNSIGAALMPVLQSLVPVLNQISDAIASVFNGIAMLNARIFNHSETAVIAQRANVNYAQTLGQTADNASNATKKVKELQNTVMGFDELNVLQKPAEDTTTPKSSTNKNPGMPDYGDMFKTVQVPEWVDKIGGLVDKITGFIKSNVEQLKRILRMAPLVIGAILVFSGANIPLGLGLMAVGAAEMGKQVKEDWDYLTNSVNSSLDKVKRVFEISGATELALGAILAFSGANPALGIGLMVGGLTTTLANLNWDSLGDNVEKSMNNILTSLGGAELIFGTIIAFSGANIPLGIGLMISGATTLGSEVAVNWDSLSTSTLNSVTSIMTGLGGATLAIGAIFAFSGANIPLGIGLMVAGAASIGTAVALDWNSGKANVSTAVGNITDFLSGAFLAVGGMLALTGVNVPLGIGLIAVGAVGMAANAAVNWNGLDNSTRNSVNSIAAIVGGSFLALGAILALTGVNIVLGIALMASGAAGLIGEVALNWDNLKESVSSNLDQIEDVVAGASLALGAILAFSGVNVPLGIAMMAAGGAKLFSSSSIDWGYIPKKIGEAIHNIPKIPDDGIAGDAEGTDYHMGGPALVNDEPGSVYRELIKLPNGKTFIPKGRNVLIPDLPVGSSVLNAEKTKQLFPNYAEGTTAIQAELSKGIQSDSKISNVFANVFTVEGKVNESVFGVSNSELDSITSDMKKASDNRMKIVDDELSSTKSKWTNFFDSISSTFGDRLDNILSICKRNSDDLSSVWNRTSDSSESIFRNMFSYIENGFSEFSRLINETSREIANNVSSKIGGSVNGVIEGINWTLSAVGSNTKIDSVTWPSYASGVDGHPGGPALVNDQSGSIYRELVQLPNGKAFIPEGKNVLISDLPKGSKVLPANKTHKLFPMYANGIGDFFNSSSADMDGLDISSVWEHMGNVGELLQLVVDKFVKKSDINEPWASLETSAVKLLTSNASDFIGKEFSKYQEAFSASGSGVERWSSIAAQALKMTGQYSEANLNRLLYQMQTESGGNPASINEWDVNWINGTPSKGLMQVIDPTFRAYAYPGFDKNIYDPLSNILAAIRYTLSRYGSLENGWQGHGYANGIGKFDFGGWYADGGLFNSPTVIGMGESGPEAALPLNDKAFSQIAQGIVKNSDEGNNENVLSRMDDIVDRMKKLEDAILDRPVALYTDDQKIAESANRGNTQIARRYHMAT